MVQKHYSNNTPWLKRGFLLACFLCLTAATAWSQDTLTVTGSTIGNKIYDGTTTAAVSPGTLEGVAEGDDVYIASVVANYNTPVVGNDKPVNVSYTLGGAQAANYVVRDTVLTSNILPRQLGITGIHIATKIYDHNIGANLDSLGHLTNLMAIDSSDVSVNISCAYINGNASTMSPVAMQYSIFGSAAGNYIAPIADTLYGIILPRPIYASGVEVRPTKVYNGNTSFFVTNNGAIDSGNVLDGDTVFHTTFVNSASPNITNGFNTLLRISFLTSGPQGNNYVILDTIDQLWGSITPLDLKIDYPSVKLVKEYDGTNIAEIISPATLLNVVDGDSINLEIEATYDNAEVGYNKPITAHFNITGPQGINYIPPADTVYFDGAIIYPTVLDTTNGPAISTLSPNYCQGDNIHLHYTLLTGHPIAYRLVFSDEALAQGFGNTVWTYCSISDSIITFLVPDNCQSGTYEVYVSFVNLAGVVSNTYTVPFTINLSNKYLVQVFDDVLSIDNSGLLDNQPNRFRTFKWYHNDQAINETKPYHQELGGLTGTYYVLVNEGGEDENIICPWNESQLVVSTPSQTVHVNPSPVVNQAQVKLQGQFENETHQLRLFNSYGNQVLSTTFTGRTFTLDMSALPHGTYLISVDGATAKTIKL